MLAEKGSAGLLLSLIDDLIGFGQGLTSSTLIGARSKFCAS